MMNLSRACGANSRTLCGSSSMWWARRIAATRRSSRSGPAALDPVFLDIRMPDMMGSDVLKGRGRRRCSVVVFTTVYDEFALQAFQEDTVDYLLKPVEEERLRSTIDVPPPCGGFSAASAPRDEISQFPQAHRQEGQLSAAPSGQDRRPHASRSGGQHLPFPERRQVHHHTRHGRKKYLIDTRSWTWKRNSIRTSSSAFTGRTLSRSMPSANISARSADISASS